MRAAVLRQLGDTTLDVVDDIEVADVAPDQVRVAIRASGVCHTDISVMEGIIPGATPSVLGHEGAGEVVEVGGEVPGLEVGDHVILSWLPPCGRCERCFSGQAQLCTALLMTAAAVPRFRIDGVPVSAGLGVGTFAEELVVPHQSAIRIPKDVPFEVAALLGCGVMTGVGAAINTARVRPGSSVVVFGCGGVGIAVIQGARIAGAAEIVAVDVVESKREEAKRFGATHAASPEGLDALKTDLTGGEGFDYGFEAIGLPATIRATYDAVRRGGTATIVGAGRMDQTVEFSAWEIFFAEKILVGSLYGSADVRRDFNRLIRLWKTGRLDLEGMISQKLDLKDINQALDDMKAGKVIRTVVEP